MFYLKMCLSGTFNIVLPKIWCLHIHLFLSYQQRGQYHIEVRILNDALYLPIMKFKQIPRRLSDKVMVVSGFLLPNLFLFLCHYCLPLRFTLLSQPLLFPSSTLFFCRSLFGKQGEQCPQKCPQKYKQKHNCGSWRTWSLFFVYLESM